jgi:hypothetical protein
MFGQKPSSPEDTRLHCAHRDAKCLSCVGHRHPFDIGEDDRGTEFGWQGIERLAQFWSDASSLHSLLSTLVCWIEVFRHWFGGSPLLFAELVVASIDRNPIYPGSHCGIALELVGFAKGGEERLLGCIEGLFPVTEDSQAYREDTSLMGTHDLVEGVVVSIHNPRQE